MKALEPAPDSTLTSSFAATSLVAVSGTNATRRSSAALSVGMATFTHEDSKEYRLVAADA
ncbi:MAG: hypothetical protein PVS3B2_00720 [Candidatus Dormibacteraceae bacterium]